jgi:Peptidase family M28
VRTLLLLGLLGLLPGCREPVFTEAPALERLRAVASGADADRILGRVRGLVEAHRGDTPTDCAALGLSDALACNHSRSAARAWIAERLEEIGADGRTVREEHEGFTTENLVFELRGEEHPEEVVLLGAHFDAFHAGADDNSSGVAVLLEVYTLLRGQRFGRTVRFVAFDHEEFGLIGSTRFVEALPREEEVVAAIVFDCVGFANHAPGSQQQIPGFNAPTTGDFLAVIANETSRHLSTELYGLNQALAVMKVAAVVAPGDGGFSQTGVLIRSDHAPLWLSGRPALFFSDTAFLRNPHYHRDTDTVETLDPQFMRGVARLAAASAAHWGRIR